MIFQFKEINGKSETISSQKQMIDGMQEFVEYEAKKSMVDEINKNNVSDSLLRY